MTVRDLPQLTCQEVVELVTELLSDALPPRDRVRLEQHLFVCPPCTLHVAQVRSTIDFTRRLGATDPPPALDPALAALFRKRRGP